jgi:hypothetical protein
MCDAQENYDLGVFFEGLVSYTPFARLLHASFTTLTRLLHPSYTPLTFLLHASCTPSGELPPRRIFREPADGREGQHLQRLTSRTRH